jgi:FKBP-type peptidyl-prolyl cis-trans isomerase
MKISLYSFLVFFSLTACKGADKELKNNDNQLDKSNKNAHVRRNFVATKKLQDGLTINWFSNGKGERIEDGEVVMIDYKVKLEDGKVVDGNHLISKKSLPFLVGYGMQTKGWDLALKEMKVGDDAMVFIPSQLARGELGVKGYIPPNADNYLEIKIIRKLKPSKQINGTKIWLLEESKKGILRFESGKKILFHAMASTATNQLFVNTYRNNQPFSYAIGDKGLVPGLQKALTNAKKWDRLYIVVPPSEAYGNDGYLDIVAPNQSVFYNVLVMDVVKN